MVFKPAPPPLFLFFPLWFDALLTRCPPCQHQPALAHLMRRLRGADAPRLLLGGWAQRAVWPSPKGASVRWGRVESPRLCCWGRAKWVRWEGTLLGEGSGAPAHHPSKARCSLPAMTSRQLRLAGLGVSQRTHVRLGFCLDIEPSWSVQVPKVSPTRWRWCRLELRRIVQVATWLVCGSSCGGNRGKSLAFPSLRCQSAALLEKDPTSCTVWPKGVSSWQIALFWTPCKVTITHITLSVA